MSEKDLQPLIGSWAPESFSRFEQDLNGNAHSALHRIRQSAFTEFQKLGFPRPQEEEWRYTDITPLHRIGFHPVSAHGLSDEHLEQMVVPGLEALRVVLVNGVFSPAHSTIQELPHGLTVGSLKDLLSGDGIPELRKRYATIARIDGQALVALNTAFLTDGVYIHVQEGAHIEKPIYLVSITSAEQRETITFPRVLVGVERGATLHMIEHHLSSTPTSYCTNCVTELYAQDGAHVSHVKLELEGSEAFHVGALHAELAQDVIFSNTTISFGGKLVRNEITPVIQGSGVSLELNGLTVLDTTQHVDNHTCIDHAAPHAQSRELYKGIYGDKASGVFSGTIIVRPDAQKTNAFQSNQSILLSREASINSKPQLKIWADDVKCTHGATVGQLDEDALFYLRSRGISLHQARQLLIHAFASDVLSPLQPAALKQYVEGLLERKLGEQ